MSDYLWDKTGEPEPEVEQLEELLGQLRFQPRTFEVPATLPFAPRRAKTAPSHSSWSRMAIAASLLVTLLLGAWLIVSKQQTVNTPQVVRRPAAEETTTPRQRATNQETAAATPKNDVAAPVRKDGQGGVNHAAVPQGHLHQREFLNVAKRSVERPRHPTVRNLNAPREEIANKMTPREKEAMEKFVLAMKVTSEKLGYAERQVATLSHDTPQR